MTADRIFALVGGGVLIAAGLLFLTRVCTAIHSPAQVYEATAVFQLSQEDGAPAQDGLQTAWRLLPADAPVGLEPDGSDPRLFRLSFRSSDPAQAVAQTNALTASMQESAKHPGAGRFVVIHPADHAVEQTASRAHQLTGDVILLLLALLPVYFGIRLALRHRSATVHIPSIP